MALTLKRTALSPAQAHATSYLPVRVAHFFTASAGEEDDGWRIWCNQALGVTFVIDDLEEAPVRMALALAEAKGLDPADVRVTMVPSR